MSRIKISTQATGQNDSQTEQRSPKEEETPQDFWSNLIFFLIITTAIGFVLINNNLSKIMSTTGVVSLGVLVLLDIFPAIQLAKCFWSRLVGSGRAS